MTFSAGRDYENISFGKFRSWDGTDDRCVQKEEFTGLCFVNLVDFDALWGHRRNVERVWQRDRKV